MQSKDEVKTNLVERLDWRFARRDESRVARRLWKKQAVDAVYSLEEGAILDEFVHFLEEVGVLWLWQELRGEGIQREMVDFFQYVLLYGMKTLFGIEAMNALPELLFSDEAAMRLAGSTPSRFGRGSVGAVMRSGRVTRPLTPSAQTPWPTTL